MWLDLRHGIQFQMNLTMAAIRTQGFEKGQSSRTKKDTTKFRVMKLPPSSGGKSKGETYSGRPVRKN